MRKVRDSHGCGHTTVLMKEDKISHCGSVGAGDQIGQYESTTIKAYGCW